MARRFRKSSTNRLLFGVAGGLGEYFNVDPLVFRVAFILLSFGSGLGVVIYLLLTLFTPRAETPVGGPLAALKDNVATAPRQVTEAGRSVIHVLRGQHSVAAERSSLDGPETGDERRDPNRDRT